MGSALFPDLSRDGLDRTAVMSYSKYSDDCFKEPPLSFCRYFQIIL
jgi:hypothetical protein